MSRPECCMAAIATAAVLSWYLMQSSLCSSFENQEPVDEDEIYRFLIFNWVAETWLKIQHQSRSPCNGYQGDGLALALSTKWAGRGGGPDYNNSFVRL